MEATNLASDPHANQHELDAPPWMRVESTLMATSRGIRDVYDQRLAVLDLNLSQASLLAYVNDFGPVSQTRVAEHLGQGRAVTGTQIDQLEARRLVERQPDPGDRRVWLIAVTDTGKDLVGAIGDIDQTLRRELRAGIPREERQALADLLVRLQHNIAAACNHPSEDRSNPGDPS